MINSECQTGLSPTGHCGAAYYCERDYSCCAACPDTCNVRCGWMGDGQDKQRGARTTKKSSAETAIPD